MPDATQLPTKGSTITATITWHRRACSRKGCKGTAGARVPDSGECIYLSRPTATGKPDAVPCGQPYTEADWTRADYSRTGRVSKVGKLPSGTPMVYLAEPGLRGLLAVTWAEGHLTSWALRAATQDPTP